MVIMNGVDWPMLSYYVIYYEKLKKNMQQTDKVALIVYTRVSNRKQRFLFNDYGVSICQYYTHHLVVYNCTLSSNGVPLRTLM